MGTLGMAHIPGKRAGLQPASPPDETAADCASRGAPVEMSHGDVAAAPSSCGTEAPGLCTVILPVSCGLGVSPLHRQPRALVSHFILRCCDPVTACVLSWSQRPGQREMKKAPGQAGKEVMFPPVRQHRITSNKVKHMPVGTSIVYDARYKGREALLRIKKERGMTSLTLSTTQHLNKRGRGTHKG